MFDPLTLDPVVVEFPSWLFTNIEPINTTFVFVEFIIVQFIAVTLISVDDSINELFDAELRSFESSFI